MLPALVLPVLLLALPTGGLGLLYELVDASRPEAAHRYPISIFAEADQAGITGPTATS